MVAAVAMISGGVVSGAASAPADTFPAERYARAEQLASPAVKAGLYGLEVEPQWFKDGDGFWYHTNTAQGRQFYRVDPKRKTRERLFDRDRLAAALERASGQRVEENQWKELRVRETSQGLRANLWWPKIDVTCSLRTYECESQPAPEISPAYIEPTAVVSPDGRWEALRRDDNLFIRRLQCSAQDGADCGQAIQLTFDGSPYWSYAIGPHYGFPYFITRDKRTPSIVWSPDSKKLAIPRADIRGVGWSPIVVYAPLRPTAYFYPEGLTSDKVIQRYDLYIADVEQRSVTRIQTPQIPEVRWYYYFNTFVQWAHDMSRFYFLTLNRGSTELTLQSADPNSGAVRVLYREANVDVNNGMRSVKLALELTAKTNQLYWWTDRDGWSHLYRGSVEGGPLKPITRGAWNVYRIEKADVKRGRMYVSAMGREPGRFAYHLSLYDMRLDGGNIRLLTPEPGSHEVKFSPSGRFLVDTYSSIDRLPVTVVRDLRDGKVLMELERPDGAALVARGWKLPEIVSTLAADGKTVIYGTVRKPSDFDPAKKYPVVDLVYPAPPGTMGQNPTWAYQVDGDSYEPTALAELGFIVVAIQGRGTPWRGRAFRNFLLEMKGHNGEVTAIDQRAGIIGLAGTRPWMDVDRVGIYGLSGGGFATANAMMRYPDFFKVGVAYSGNHDDRSMAAGQMEAWHGPMQIDPLTGQDPYAPDANPTLAGNLQGKLLLGLGMYDLGFPGQAFRYIDALIKADRKFDLFINPVGSHEVANWDYKTRLTFDYFVQHLLGMTPPQYRFSSDHNRPAGFWRDALLTSEYEGEEALYIEAKRRYQESLRAQ